MGVSALPRSSTIFLEPIAGLCMCTEFWSTPFLYACELPSQPGPHFSTLGFWEREVPCVWSALPRTVVSRGSQLPLTLARAARAGARPAPACCAECRWPRWWLSPEPLRGQRALGLGLGPRQVLIPRGGLGPGILICNRLPGHVGLQVPEHTGSSRGPGLGGLTSCPPPACKSNPRRKATRREDFQAGGPGSRGGRAQQ